MKYFHNFLTDDECNYLINLVKDKVPLFNIEDNRNLDVFPILEPIPFLSDKLDKIGIIGNPQFNINKYGEGCYFETHTDRGGKNDPMGKRLRTIIINLSDDSDYTGGYLYIGKKVMSKDRGGCIMFSSDIEHSLSPIKSGVRYSVVFWLNKENIKGLIRLI